MLLWLAAYLSLAAAVSLPIAPKEQFIKGGQNAVINCTTEPGAAVNWEHRPKLASMAPVYVDSQGLVGRYRATGRYAVEANKTSGRHALIIQNVSRIDGGFYCCRAGESLSSSQTARLAIIDAERPWVGVIAIEGSPVRLVWGPLDAVPYRLEHIRANEPYPNELYGPKGWAYDYSALGRFAINSAPGACDLSITSARKEDAGTYICAPNGTTEKNAQIDLLVIRKQCLEFTCSACRLYHCLLAPYGHASLIHAWLDTHCVSTLCYIPDLAENLTCMPAVGQTIQCFLNDPANALVPQHEFAVSLPSTEILVLCTMMGYLGGFLSAWIMLAAAEYCYARYGWRMRAYSRMADSTSTLNNFVF